MLSIVLLVLSLVVPSAPLQGAAGRLHGVVADESGGVMPGVTVVATAADGRVIGTAVTDEVGRYAFPRIAASSVRLTFQLEGFADSIVDVAIAPGTDAAVATQRLKLAQKSETVVVRGEIPVPAPPPPAPRIAAPPPPPPPALQPVPVHDHDSICGPAKPGTATGSFGTIQSRKTAAGLSLYGMGDELMIDGGKANGLEVGQNLVARRAYRTSADPDGVAGEHTSGLVQIVATGERASVAVVIYACDEMRRGDWLAAFRPEPVRAPEVGGMPAFDRAAHILLTDADQLIGAPRRLMVIDRGTDNGIRVGQRLTLFRPASHGRRSPAVLGDAVVVAVRADSATIRVQNATDVIALGDSAAPQQP